MAMSILCPGYKYIYDGPETKIGRFTFYKGYTFTIQDQLKSLPHHYKITGFGEYFDLSKMMSQIRPVDQSLTTTLPRKEALDDLNNGPVEVVVNFKRIGKIVYEDD